MPRVIVLSNPRSGSTYLQELLGSHPEIHLAGEILNEENLQSQNPLSAIQTTLSDLNNTVIGFKLFPEQLYANGLHFGHLVDTLGVTHVVVIWRENLLEGFVSRRIADTTNVWYSTEKATQIHKVTVDLEDFKSYISDLTNEWQQIGSEWPVDVRPIFVKFEDLLKNPNHEIKRVFAELSLTSGKGMYTSCSQRQNPASIEDKIINFAQLPKELPTAKLDVRKILQGKIEISLQIPSEVLHLVPDREPCMPPNGWTYRVAEPYMPAIAKQNVFDAINSGSISSAGYWPKEMAKRLRSIFGLPVAQPCSHGFTALLLAMQSAGIKTGDEVIVPTMTMIAVSNAVKYLGATPRFADNAKESYNPGWKEYEIRASENTKAIVVTHTYGVPAYDIDQIAKECQTRGWTLIEDISECVGITTTNSKGQPQLLGTFGDFAIASLYVNKIVHGGDGGFVLAKQAKIGKRLTSIVNHGFTPSFHFVHYEVSPNAKINGIGAAVATGVLDKLPYIMHHRSQVANWYRRYLANVPVKHMPECGPKDTPWVFGIECQSKQERTALRAHMAKYGIETRDYFFCLHLQPAYADALEKPFDLPIAEKLGSTGFYLPTHSNLKESDVEYICNAMKSYFTIDNTPINAPVKAKVTDVVQITPDDFSVQVRRYLGSGELKNTIAKDHTYLRAVQLGMRAETLLLSEQYDRVKILIAAMQQELQTVGGDPAEKAMTKFFNQYISYFECQLLEQAAARPWLQIDLKAEQFSKCNAVPTTTDPETLQILTWLIEQRKPETIWEIGCWMGHATLLMSLASTEKSKIFAMDCFKWQPWMSTYIKDMEKCMEKEGKSFLNIFKNNLAGSGEKIETVEWPYNISKLPETLKSKQPQLVYLDITQEDDDLENIWEIIKTSLIPNETIILFNGLAFNSIPFFTRHATELRAFAKPHTLAKAFLFVGNTSPKSIEKQAMTLKRTLKVVGATDWEHHHNNLFNKAVDQICQQFHDNQAQVLFFPAVEQAICDEQNLFYENPWIGIIHSVEHHSELFYVPDLHRLCSRDKYLGMLKNCKGLFTLTKFQADYLKKHLPEALPRFPIQTLNYPIECLENEPGSKVIEKLRENDVAVDVLHIGSFARDFEFFFNAKLPKNFRKVFVAGDDECKEAAQNAPSDVTVVGRLSAAEYEQKIRESVIFLTLKYEGAANTLLLECISRNLPILVPRNSTCIQFLGDEYPLYYDSCNEADIKVQLAALLKIENIESAISYIKNLDKTQFGYEKFIRDVRDGIVMRNLSPVKITGSGIEGTIPNGRMKYDVTLCICSYKRTHHLEEILDSLWNKQDFKGSYEIVVWNNNECRQEVVQSITKQYVETPTENKALELISSTENHYCSIRFAMASLMKGECLLICDDDIIPAENFISFFHQNHQKYPEDVLCLRGHEFLPHTLNENNPESFWVDYEHLRFRDDDKPEQFIHFVHADACLIPKQALQEVGSVDMPDPEFVLVDDYWMSYVLNQIFGRKLRKLSTAKANIVPIIRTDDSDTVGLALHTRPEVQDARLRLYIHHMLQRWPTWEQKPEMLSDEQVGKLREEKSKFWRLGSQLGWNISGSVDKGGIETLKKWHTKCARIGAVGVGEKYHFEFGAFLKNPNAQLEKLVNLVNRLEKAGINVIITLDRRIASASTWKLIANSLVTFSNVVGYDLVNEPFTEQETEMHWSELEDETNKDSGMHKVFDMYQEMMLSIREVDKATPIILEPTSWGRIGAINKFPIHSLMEIDDNIVVSCHFYEPHMLTQRGKNKGRFTFPGDVPWYDSTKFQQSTLWDETKILGEIQKLKDWADTNRVKVFLGEFGISRDISGAPAYLNAIIKACRETSIHGFLFSFRDQDWDAMDYEFGSELGNHKRNLDENLNPFGKILKAAF